MQNIQKIRQKTLETLRLRWRAWIVLLAMAGLLGYSARLSEVARAVEAEAFRAQWTEKVRALDMLLDQTDEYVSAYDDWGEYDYAGELMGMASRFDAWPGVFCALYSDELELLSRRITMDGERGLDPLDTPGMLEALSQSDRGAVMADYTDADDVKQESVAYFRWIPSGAARDSRLLMIVSMRQDALAAKPAEPLIGWCVGLVAASLLAVAACGAAMNAQDTRKIAGKKRDRHE